MIDLSNIFKKAAGHEEDHIARIEDAVQTLKTELACNMTITQEAADALDVLYQIAADHVSLKDVEMALRELSAKRNVLGAAGFGSEAENYNDCIKIFEKHIYKTEDNNDKN